MHAPTTPTLEQQWLDQLAQAGYRPTAARRVVIEIVLNTRRALEPLEIFTLARRQHPKLGLVTVYRTLETLEALGLVQRVHQPGGCNIYLRAFEGHQHLLICTACGRAVFFEGDDLSALMERAARQSGFVVHDHWLQLFGTCAECRAAQSAPLPA